MTPYRVGRPHETARNKRIFDLWLACYTQEEIAEAVGCDQDTVSDIVRKSASLPDSVKPAAAHLTDFQVPLYNVWRQQETAPPPPPNNSYELLHCGRTYRIEFLVVAPKNP